MLYRFLLVLSAGAIVMMRWYFIDTSANYMVGYPSPHTYLARVTTRFVDRDATNESRHLAAEQIVTVRVRNNASTQIVRENIAALKNNGDVSFASPRLAEMVRALSDDVRTGVIDTAVEIAEKNYDKAVTRAEQTAVIWDNLRDSSLAQADKNVVFQLLDSLLIPTVAEDAEMADRLRNDISSHIPSFTRNIEIGKTLVQQGQVVTSEMAGLLRENGYPDAAIPWKHLGFVVITTFAWSLWFTWIGLRQESPPSHRDWLYMFLLLVIDWIFQSTAARWNIDALSLLGLAGWLFLTVNASLAFQVTLGGGLLGYIMAFPGMTSSIAVGCVLCGVVSGASFLFIKEASSRIKIWANVLSLGLCLTFTSAFLRWGMGLAVTPQMLEAHLISALVWSTLVVALLPLWEYVFDIISPLRLLEMSHPSQPLLKRLQLEAPGTYHHTVTVGTFAEAVADKVGMNGLLIKTGAYYHDIGKLKRPHYFVENQSFGDNIHDRLGPYDSARMILSHVPDGLKLADEYKIPKMIKNFIAEHHGTTCITYFYQKALAEDKEAGRDGSSVDRDDFCYPGPAPQRPETALLMLADSTDAALKGLKNPLAGRAELEKLVDDVVNSKIMSGQFVDVNFTLKELSAIKNAMVDTLMSMYHTREIKPLSHPAPDGVPDADEAEPQAGRSPDAAAVFVPEK
jgi:putative nucleotidyltransferase with HDIG domain